MLHIMIIIVSITIVIDIISIIVSNVIELLSS